MSCSQRVYRWRGVGVWICGLALLLSVFVASAAASVERIELMLADQRFVVEYVADPDSRRQGLMGRKNLAAGTGMLFDFPQGTQPAIWMRNMVISLDLLYVDETGEIAQIFPNVPPCSSMPCQIYHADQPLRFVLEVPAGTARNLGLEEGQILDLGDLLEEPAPRW